jgi:hypothetical protein
MATEHHADLTRSEGFGRGDGRKRGEIRNRLRSPLLERTRAVPPLVDSRSPDSSSSQQG